MTVSRYLGSFADLCLRFFPLAFLLLYPYEKERIRSFPLSAGIVYAVLGLAAAAGPVLFTGIYTGVYRRTVTAALILAFYFLVRDGLTRKSMVLFIAVFCLKMQTALSLGYGAVWTYLPDRTVSLDQMLFPGETLLIHFLTAAFLVPAAALFERRVLKSYLRIVPRYIMWLEILLLAVADGLFYMLALFCDGVVLAYLDSIGSGPAWVVLPPLFLFVLTLCALYYAVFRMTLIRQAEFETRQMELLRENSVSLQRKMRRSHEIYHDLRQLLRQMNTLYEQGGGADLRPYVEKIVDLTAYVDTVFCENQCLNALFQYYTGYAADRNIPMNISAVCGDVSIQDTDLTLLVANALENAVTGAEEYREQRGLEPDVTVTAGVIQHRLLIQIVNPCADVKYSPRVKEREKNDMLPADAFESTHAEGKFGLKQMETIAGQYQGTAQFQYNEKDSLWITRIAVPVRVRTREKKG